MHGLPAVTARVGDEPIATVGHPLGLGHLECHLKELSGQKRVGYGRAGHISVVRDRNDQYVHRCLGVDVAESDDAVGTHDDVGGNIAG